MAKYLVAKSVTTPADIKRTSTTTQLHQSNFNTRRQGSDFHVPCLQVIPDSRRFSTWATVLGQWIAERKTPSWLGKPASYSECISIRRSILQGKSKC
jgi:hypothetical protein